MKFRTSITLVLTVLLLASSTAYGCLTSPGEVPLCHIYQTTDIIFVGEVLSSEPEATSLSEGSATESQAMRSAWLAKYNSIRFAISKNLKGVEGDAISTKALAAAVTSCDTVYDFRPGEKWLVFAQMVQGKGIQLTNAMSFKDKDVVKRVSELSKIKRDGIKSGLYGQFRINYPLSRVNIKGFRVTARTNDRILTTEMDEYGQFSFREIESGEYSIKVFLPYDGYVRDEVNADRPFMYDDESTLYIYEFAATVKENECFYKRIGAFPRENSEYRSLPKSTPSLTLVPSSSRSLITHYFL